MSFSTKRGRPKLNLDKLAKVDSGTPELKLKRSKHLTEELIDRLLRLELINTHQHQVALTFRWLYGLKFGSLRLRAYLPAIYRNSCNQDESWLKEQADKYQLATNELSKIKALELITDIVIFGKNSQVNNYNFQYLALAQHHKLQEGLNLLIKLIGN